MVRHDEHTKHLNYLFNHLNEVGEDPNTIGWVMKEGLWTRFNSTAANPLCDLVIVYYHDYESCVELKRSRHHLSRAAEQLEWSKTFVQDWLSVRNVGQKIVYYGNHARLGYEVEIVDAGGN